MGAGAELDNFPVDWDNVRMLQVVNHFDLSQWTLALALAGN